ncbi:MAG TPA: CDP-alcohol phosphatidyltransferase family protein [Acidobacteriota bacterium]|nr:CDP-alcohol phosphatidyltransferase family protein [Acidobacteriota bacterium]HRR55942.1 CDP-alcohol phosphatidyltransferase family protein [Acidobacteriota bacterium]HRV07117.1 CDP-alcohol phosphatidyltransferase family protein [Acidobacteriota bacterium]
MLPVTPNQLTVLRMALVPLFILLVVYSFWLWALITFLVAGVTDLLDGMIARRWGRKTDLGTLLDPLADKLLLVSSFVLFTFSSVPLVVRLPLWLTITVISRDLLLVGGVLVFNLTVERRAFPPSILGKATTVSQLFLILWALIGNTWGRTVPGHELLIWTVLGLTVTSGLHYMLQGMRLIAAEWEK